MFNTNNFLTKTKKNLLEQRFKNYLKDSVNKFDKLMIEINNKNKNKQNIENILNESRLITNTNHIDSNLINNLKYHNYIFIFSVISIGALLFYKSI